MPDAAGPPALFRIRLADGSVRLAAGRALAGPAVLLDPGLTIGQLLREGRQALAAAASTADGDPVPAGAAILAPVEDQEVWAAGVTYRRSHEARAEETTEPSVYDRVYVADRPELFLKAPGSRVRGPGEPVGVRADSAWDVPEPELVLVLTSTLEVAGYTLGNDVSSRAIEGENPLYLPQAKVYTWSCAIGPALVPAGAVELPVDLSLTVSRDGETRFAGATSTAAMRRSPDELADYLGRALAFPSGAFLMTGTGIVPDASFSLQAGDVVDVDGGPLGTLRNPVERVGRAPSDPALPD